MLGAWSKLWDEALDVFQRDNMIHDTIGFRGGQILAYLGAEPANKELEAEVDCLRWILRRHTWIMGLSWRQIDRWIKKHFPDAKKLPQQWSFTKLIKQAFTERVMEGSGDETI